MGMDVRLRRRADEVLREMGRAFDAACSEQGRPSIPPEALLKALLLQVLYSIPSERRLVDAINWNLLYRWFCGLDPDAAMWDGATFTNPDRVGGGARAGAEVFRAGGALVAAQGKGTKLRREKEGNERQRKVFRSHGPRFYQSRCRGTSTSLGRLLPPHAEVGRPRLRIWLDTATRARAYSARNLSVLPYG